MKNLVLKMGNSAALILGISTFCFCVCIYAQNETLSQEVTSTEENRTCTNNVTHDTNYMCELDTANMTPSSDIITETEEFTGTTEIVGVESTLFTEVVSIGNETGSDLPVTISTVKSEIQTTTETIPATTEMVVEARPVSNEICTCDVNMNSCDINCCCDDDCSDNDRLAFSGCHTRTSFNFDSHHCYQTHFVYHNNTELKLVRNEGGLFCILRDNLPERFTYQNRKVVTTLLEFNKLHRNHKTFSWPAKKVHSPLFDSTAPFRQGSIMWTVVNRTLVPFSLPMKVTHALCQASRAMYYLNDWSGTCQVPAIDVDSCESHRELSANTFYKGFTVLVSPQFINETYGNRLKEDCLAHVCIPVTVHLCSELRSKIPSFEQCTEVSDLQPSVHNSELQHCENVVKEVQYMIYHNGTVGITKVCAYLWLTNVTLNTRLSQKFSITFHWARDTKSFHRSGNPGYIVGKPVMSGKKVTQILGTEGEIDKEAIEIDENPEKWLSIAGAKNDGRCDLEGSEGKSVRHPVTFGENRRSSCMVFVIPSNFIQPSACAALHKAVIQLLSGNMMANVTSPKEFNFYIANFGDAKVEDTGDWTQVILESVPSFLVSSSESDDWTLVCKGIVTSIHIDIMFANVGSLAIPQAKVLGSVFRFGPPHDIIFTCSSLHCAHETNEQHFDVVSSVSFIDVTKHAVVEFAEPPVYEVKLPHDFFYPFFSNSPLLSPSNTLLLVSLFFFPSVQSRIH